VKRDSFSNINALHFTESSNDFVIDWITPDYITKLADGANGPQAEFPFLAAASDPTRNAILLAYQTDQFHFVFVDPLLNDMNSIFLKEAYATIAQILPDGSKTFIPFQTYMERDVQFGMSVLSDGTIWLAYQPINSQNLTWNEVHASKYQGGAWSAPVLVGFNHNNYNVASEHRDPGCLVSRADQAQVAFLTPDQKVHSFTLSDTAPPPPPADTTPPTTSITSPLDGATVSGTVSVSAAASDNVGVAKVELWLDGSLKDTKTAAPYNFLWDAAAGSHTLSALAYDAAGNVGASVPVVVTVAAAAAPIVAITTPRNGSTVPRKRTVTITATATDSVGVAKVEFYVDDSLIGVVAASPFTCPWQTPARKNAAYTIKAEAYSVTGKTASDTVTVTAN
jgi:hypothetical protein